MKTKIVLPIAILLLFATACITVTPDCSCATPTGSLPSYTPEGTVAIATQTPTPSVPPPPPAPTYTPIPAPTEPVLYLGPNRIANGGFEEGFEPVSNGQVAAGWGFWYLKDTPVPQEFDPPWQSAYYGWFLEYNPCSTGNTDTARVHSGQECQKWFSFYNQSLAGIYQGVSTTAGEQCEVDAYAHVWSDSEFSTGDAHQSALYTDDLVDAATFLIGVDLSGGTDPQSPTVIWHVFRAREGNPYYPYIPLGPGVRIDHVVGTDPLYDPPSQLFEASFTAVGSRTTLFVFSHMMWANSNQDTYVDDISLRCWGTDYAPGTPAPAEPIIPEGYYHADRVYKIVRPSLPVRGGPGEQFPVVAPARVLGETFRVLCVAELVPGEVWGSTDGCSFTASNWTAIWIGSTVYAEAVSGPEG